MPACSSTPTSTKEAGFDRDERKEARDQEEESQHSDHEPPLHSANYGRDLLRELLIASIRQEAEQELRRWRRASVRFVRNVVGAILFVLLLLFLLGCFFRI